LIATREAVEASQKSLKLVTEEYNGGLTDYNRVFNIQLLLVQDQDRYATTQGDVALTLIGIYRALGGGWEVRNGYVPLVNEIMPEEVAIPDAIPIDVDPNAELIPPQDN
jgi:hypothetical protein